MSVPENAYDQLQAIHHPPTTFISKYIWSGDHKIIAKQFLWGGLIFLLLGMTGVYIMKKELMSIMIYLNRWKCV